MIRFLAVNSCKFDESIERDSAMFKRLWNIILSHGLMNYLYYLRDCQDTRFMFNGATPLLLRVQRASKS